MRTWSECSRWHSAAVIGPLFSTDPDGVDPSNGSY